MTEQDPQLPDDHELEEFLARRSALSRLHREAAQEQAPPQLDAKVLQAAREALRQARPPRRLLRWDTPLALAASAVLVLGLGWLTLPRAPAPVAEGELVRPSAARMAPAPAMPAPVPPPPAATEQSQRQSLAITGQRADVAPTPPAKPMPPPAGVEAKPFSRAKAQKFVAPPQVYGGSVAPPREPAPVADQLPAESPRDAPAEAPIPVPMPAQAPAPPPPPAPAARLYAEPAPAPAIKTQAPAVADPCGAPPRPPAQQRAQPEQHLDSPAWLDQVRQLRQTDEAAARAELACFVTRRSAAEVPADLQPLLPRR